jgi:hypothetical protein
MRSDGQKFILVLSVDRKHHLSLGFGVTRKAMSASGNEKLQGFAVLLLAAIRVPGVVGASQRAVWRSAWRR